MRAHLLVRGERPVVPTGHHLLARMLGDVTYVPRSEYADRAAMFARHMARVRAQAGPAARVCTAPLATPAAAAAALISIKM